MAFTGFLLIGTIAAAAAAFLLAVRRTTLLRAAGVAGLVFLGAAGASIAFVGLVVSRMSD